MLAPLRGHDEPERLEIVRSVRVYTDSKSVAIDGRSCSCSPMTNESAIGARLGAAVSRLRRQRGLSQAELAEQLELSVDYISRLERGQRLPALPVLVAIRDLFGVSFDVLLAESDVADQDGWLRNATTMLRNVRQEDRRAVFAMLIGVTTPARSRSGTRLKRRAAGL